VLQNIFKYITVYRSGKFLENDLFTAYFPAQKTYSRIPKLIFSKVVSRSVSVLRDGSPGFEYVFHHLVIPLKEDIEVPIIGRFVKDDGSYMPLIPTEMAERVLEETYNLKINDLIELAGNEDGYHQD